MTAYAALLSLAHTTHLSRKQEQSLFSSDAEEKLISIHDYANFLLLFFEQFPHKVKRWEGRIRDAAHEIEDIIEVFMWRLIQSRHSVMNPSRVELEDQLEYVMEKIGLIAGEVMEERPAYLSASSSSSSSSRISPAGNDAVVGLDDDIMVMKERLCGHPSDLRVVPIVGLGGIGKSTLARTLYEDQLIIESFDIRAWVVVSQDYSPSRFKKTLLGSIKTLEEQMLGDVMDESDIELKVFQNLKGWRYLVVIDDVWGTHVWDDVRYMFPNDKNGSRIMLTTRQLDVATYPSPAGVVHEMQFMNESQSWDLLKQKVFTNSYCPSKLEEVGKEIARRCAGLPLAVVLVAGVLSPVNSTRASWEEIAENVNPDFGREIEEILSLSYNYLPHHLRPCFLFIGGFLEDVNISASRLIRLWVSEGFVKHKHGCFKSMEEEADEYLEDLVKKNLVIATSRKSDGKIKSCNLHDMVRGLCIRKAHEEKFLHVIDGPDLPRCLMNERRISFSHSDVSTIWGPTFHTILCFQSQKFSSWLALIGSYKLLRVFDALGVDLKELPCEVFELYHLRYLALTGSFSISSLVYNLVNLQTLIVYLSSGKLRQRYGDGVHYSLPWEIWRMPQLRHLVFHAPCMLPLLIEGFNYLPLENLQTLLLVKDLVWNENIIQMIPNVKKLGLLYTTSQEYHLHHLKDLHHLIKLEVAGYLNFSWRTQIPSFPYTLKKLTLVGGGFPWKDMVVVGSLPNLEVLNLLHYACDGDTWETSDEEFPQLKVLLIDESRLRRWITHSSPFPTLKHLVLRYCSYLREIPEGLGKTSTVELIEVDHCRNSLVESARNIKEEQESCGNYALQVRTGHEEIKSVHKQMDLSPSSPEASSLDEDLIEIKERLYGNSSKLQVVKIVGTGGVGKTTLATAICYDPLILEHFEVRAWLTVSRTYGPHGPLDSLVYSMKLLEEEVSWEKIDESEMAAEIYRNLICRRYLVVVDDVWSTSLWDNLRKMFPDDGNGSRILLTTRLLRMNVGVNSSSPPHLMGFMYDYQSWILLKKKVFRNQNLPPELEDVGKEIARRCAGLPLSIVLIAGVLSAVDKTRATWNEIARNINSDVGDVGSKLQEILYLSYSQLPHHLRPCFLYMGVFPEHESIHASRLIRSWRAEGVLKRETGFSRSLEEGEDFLEDLVKRNLVNVTSRKNDGRIESCNVHDLVRDFCISRSAEEKKYYGWARDLPMLDR